MDSQASLHTLLGTATFGVAHIDAIIVFRFDTLNKLASISSKDLDTGIANIHKSMASLTVASGCVRINVPKCMLFHAIRLHF